MSYEAEPQIDADGADELLEAAEHTEDGAADGALALKIKRSD